MHNKSSKVYFLSTPCSSKNIFYTLVKESMCKHHETILQNLNHVLNTIDVEKLDTSAVPNEKQIENARAFAKYLDDMENISQPSIHWAEYDEEIVFFWSNSKIYLDLGFYDEDEVGYYAILKDEEGNQKETISYTDEITYPFPKSIINSLRVS